MMGIPAVTFFFLALICIANSHPLSFNLEEENANNTIEDVGNIKIDLSHFGQRLFGKPSNATGNLVAKWTPEMNVNPEEMGEYLEGDILHPPPTSKSGLVEPSSMWSNGVVPYIITGRFSSAERNQIMSAIADYHSLTCIKLVPRTTQADYLDIGNAPTGCWSRVGRTGGRQMLNLQSPGCVSKKGTIIHEIMHALGFIHEQSRPERDNFVTILFQNIQSGSAYNFNKYPSTTVSDFGVPYDYGSVMHYSAYAFSANNKPTIVPKRAGAQLGQREGFGPNDVKSINARYKCKRGPFQAITSLIGSIFGK